MDWDRGRVYSSDQGLVAENNAGRDAAITNADAQKKFREFIRTFREEHLFPYRDQLLARWRKGERYLEVDLGDLSQYDQELHSLITNHPNTYLPFFEMGVKDALELLVPDDQRDEVRSEASLQVTLRSEQEPMGMREITAAFIGKLIKVGIH